MTQQELFDAWAERMHRPLTSEEQAQTYADAWERIRERLLFPEEELVEADILASSSRLFLWAGMISLQSSARDTEGEMQAERQFTSAVGDFSFRHSRSKRATIDALTYREV